MRRVLEWIGIISLLLSIGLTILWADSLLAKRQYDVLSLTENLNILVADGRVTFFGDLGERARIQPRVFSPRGFGAQLAERTRILRMDHPGARRSLLLRHRGALVSGIAANGAVGDPLRRVHNSGPFLPPRPPIPTSDRAVVAGASAAHPHRALARHLRSVLAPAPKGPPARHSEPRADAPLKDLNRV